MEKSNNFKENCEFFRNLRIWMIFFEIIKIVKKKRTKKEVVNFLFFRYYETISYFISFQRNTLLNIILGGVFMKMKNSIFLCFFIGSFMLAGCTKDEVIIKAEVSSEVTEMKRNDEEKQTEHIYVYVCGQVEKPGVYKVAADARVCDALELVGGILEDGNAEILKQAEHMTDGETIYVPSVNEDSPEEGSKDDGKVNINTASKEELMTLPGIGESKADIIIEYREEHGAFQSIEELMEIQGIKEGVFNKIKDNIKTS